MALRTKQTRTVERRQRVVQFITVKKQILQCEPVYVALGQIVKELRLKRGMTQEQLAERLHLQRTSVCNIEIGRQRVLLSDLWDIAAALGVTPKSIFNRLDD